MKAGSIESGERFLVFYGEHARSLLGYFVRRTFDPESAADLTAETFAEAFAMRSRFRDRGYGPGPWLYGIAHNKLLRYYRTQGVESSARVKLGMPDRSALSAMDAARIDELIDLEERGRAVRHALAQLPQPEQDALTLRVVEMRAYREIAGLLGCTEQAARARVCRGLQKLNRLLPSEGTL